MQTLPGFSAHGIFQARILEWVAISYSKTRITLGKLEKSVTLPYSSACSAGNPGLIPRSGRSTGEGIGYSVQYSWASLVAQTVKNPPAMWGTWVGNIPWRRERLPAPVFWPGEFHGVAKCWTPLRDFHFHLPHSKIINLGKAVDLAELLSSLCIEYLEYCGC